MAAGSVADPGRYGRLARVELEATEEAFARVRNDLLERIAATTPAQKEERETAYMAVFVLGRVREALVQAAANVPLEQYQQAIEQVTSGNTQH